MPFRSYRSLYCSNFGHCVIEPPFGGLGATHDAHLGLTGKRVVDFLLVIIELLSLDVTGEALRAKIDRKWAIWPKISGRRGRPTPTIFALIVKPMNALQLCR